MEMKRSGVCRAHASLSIALRDRCGRFLRARKAVPGTRLPAVPRIAEGRRELEIGRPLSIRFRRRARELVFDRTIEETQFVLFSVVLDKQTHQAADYRKIKDDYHCCVEALLERYCGRMRKMNLVGDVMAESRGGSQDRL